ncbi:threonine ammonia-lyase [Stappia taiwanensis]|uniref:Threonine ammonia-lyase n=1 Tax=Stappia taiwanensis TaxID=992267 RepID=A0A838XME0_9HYPH|nr:threonine ammonia-lyase [Stappia taiwanensis]MBA4610201.1 threonine ammonia-lyase [Stappia taiwanensis]GGE77710.1 L-threonine dehydratase catabolic TdcB [Stappia taiwanensis]
MQVTLQSIQDAARSIAGAVMQTPCLPAPKLSQLTGADIRVKYENLQVTNAFKERGALVKLLTLSEDERARGVIAMSAGNHAQAVAYHARRLGIPATIVMPEPTPFVKVAATRSYGAQVVLAGEMLADAQAEAERRAEEHGLVWVHPYDDPAIICGQGTIALEMLEAQPDLDCLVVPIGGGGLIAGMATAAKALKPGIEIVGVEPELYPSMLATLRGEQATCGGATLAEGIAVKNVGVLTQKIARDTVDDILLVNEDAIEQAVNAYLTRQKTMAEGAGAAGLAAVLTTPERFAGRRVGLVMCGGNIDPRLLSSIMVRALAREGRMLSIRIATQDRPGVLGEIASLVGTLGGNILEVSHHRLFLNVPAKGTTLDVTMETHDRAHADRIIAALEEHGHKVKPLDLGESRL